ncbi:MAG: hypothetical protein ACK4NC_05085 [Candidatus Gracilibacteria bacterium]
MQLFKYILLDQSGKTRIGYIEGESKDSIAKKFQTTGVKQILSIDTFTLANVNLLDRRKFFSFSAVRQDDTKMEGTIEHLTDLDAYKELVEEHRLTVSILVEGNRELQPLRMQFEAMTDKIKDKYDSLKKSQDLKSQTKKFFSEKKVTIDESAQIANLLDRDFKDLLRNIQETTKPLLLDKNYQEDIESVHTTIAVLLGRPNTTVDQKYDFLAYLLRELSFIEDTIDNAFSRDKIKKVLVPTVQLLKKIEQIKVRLNPEPVKPVVIEEPKPQQNMIFGNFNQGQRELETMGKNLASQTKKTAAAPSADNFEELKTSFVRYQEKKEQVKAIEADIEKLKREEIAHSDIYPPLHVSSEHAILQELPNMTEWLCMFYLLVAVSGEQFFLNNKPFILGTLDIASLFAAIGTQAFNLKIILSFLLFHTVLLIWKAHPKNRRLLFGSFAILAGIIFYMFYFL